MSEHGLVEQRQTFQGENLLLMLDEWLFRGQYVQALQI